jgi:hypothetical protein
MTFIGNLIRANTEMLRSLTVGQKLDAGLSSYQEPISQYEDNGEVLMALSFKDTLLKLSSLQVVGLSVSPEQSNYFSESIELSRLRNLTLESCPGSATLFHQLAATVTTDGSEELALLALREFALRHETPDQPLVAALEAFLGRANPLTLLSVLFDNTDIMPTVKCFIARHRATLESLYGKVGVFKQMGAVRFHWAIFTTPDQNCQQSWRIVSN